MMFETILWIIFALVAIIAILVIVLLLRVSQGFLNAGKEMRDEFRAGREEARSAGKDLREEVSAGLKSANDTLFKTLEGMSKLSQTQLEFQCSDNRLGDFFLHRKDVSEFAIERLRPFVVAVGNPNEMCGDSYSVATVSDGTLQ